MAMKTKNAIAAGMSVILCIGEQLAERENGTTMVVCAEQLAAVASELTESMWEKIVIAYEPVWAIGRLATTRTIHRRTHFVIL